MTGDGLYGEGEEIFPALPAPTREEKKEMIKEGAFVAFATTFFNPLMWLATLWDWIVLPLLHRWELVKRFIDSDEGWLARLRRRDADRLRKKTE